MTIRRPETLHCDVGRCDVVHGLNATELGQYHFSDEVQVRAAGWASVSGRKSVDWFHACPAHHPFPKEES
jgi:hypothetical protein